MNKIYDGWRLGGRAGTWLALVYALSAATIYYVTAGLGNSDSPLWIANRPPLINWINSGIEIGLLTGFLSVIPVGLARLAGSVAGALTGILAGVLHGTPARIWGMFCFSLPPVIFHAAAHLRPVFMMGDHWLNSYWFWVGVPSLVCILAGGWIGERLAGRTDMVFV